MAGLKIFVRYTSADRDWAHWIAWTLKEAGHEPFVHEWEIGAGREHPRLDGRTRRRRRIACWASSPTHYIDPVYSKSERTAAYLERSRSAEPLSSSRYEVEPRDQVADASVTPLKRLSLVGLDQDAARTALIGILGDARPAQGGAEVSRRQPGSLAPRKRRRS